CCQGSSGGLSVLTPGPSPPGEVGAEGTAGRAGGEGGLSTGPGAVLPSPAESPGWISSAGWRAGEGPGVRTVTGRSGTVRSTGWVGAGASRRWEAPESKEPDSAGAASPGPS